MRRTRNGVVRSLKELIDWDQMRQDVQVKYERRSAQLKEALKVVNDALAWTLQGNGKAFDKPEEAEAAET
jgi:hypothetical protein